MSLTIKQENFCLAYIETGNASEAYRQSYDASKMKEESINVNASKLLINTKIALRLKDLRAPAIEAAQITLTQHLDDLKRLRDLAESSEKYGPAIQAEVARGKASGLYVENVNISGSIGMPAITITKYAN